MTEASASVCLLLAAALIKILIFSWPKRKNNDYDEHFFQDEPETKRLCRFCLLPFLFILFYFF